jgi:hypothetical protein
MVRPISQIYSSQDGGKVSSRDSAFIFHMLDDQFCRILIALRSAQQTDDEIGRILLDFLWGYIVEDVRVMACDDPARLLR